MRNNGNRVAFEIPKASKKNCIGFKQPETLENPAKDTKLYKDECDKMIKKLQEKLAAKKKAAAKHKLKEK